VAFVGENQRIVGHVFEQCRRRFARLAAGEVARIILDARAGPGGIHHFQIEGRALFEPLRFEQPAGAIELVEALAQLVLDACNRLNERRPRRHVMRVSVDFDEVELVGFLAGERIHLLDFLDLIAEQMDAPGAVFVVRGKNVDRVATHTE